MHDVHGRLRHLRNRNRAMHAFGFGNRRARQRVILRRGASVRQSALDNLVDDDAVLRVHTNQTAALTGGRHRAIDRRIVNEKDAWIRHEQLETRHALIHHAPHLRQSFIFEISRDEMKTVINRRLAFGLRVPVIQCLSQRLALVLHREINDRRRPAVSRRPRPRKEIIRRLRPAERQLHMRVRIDPAGDDELTRRINHALRFYVEPRPDERDDFILNQHVRLVIINSGDDAPVTNDSFHYDSANS